MSLFVSIIQDKGTVTADNIAITGGINDYDALYFTNDFSGAGVAQLEDANAFVVTEDSPAGLSVEVQPGVIYVENSSFTPTGTNPRAYRIRSDSVETIAISANASGSTRYDLIVVDIDTATAPNDDASNIGTVTKVEGTPGAGWPAVGSDQEVLGVVEVVNGASSITNSDIIDRRRFVNQGFKSVTDTLVFGSDADDPQFTATITGVDRTGLYKPGMKLRLFQETGGEKFFIVTASAFSTDTTLTLFGGTDYDLENETIFDLQVSTVNRPLIFPADHEKWTVEVLISSTITIVSPTTNVWVNDAGASIDIPVGIWETSYESSLVGAANPTTLLSLDSTLSTTNNSETDVRFTKRFFINTFSSGSYSTIQPLNASHDLELTTMTTYYLNLRSAMPNISQLRYEGNLVFIRAISRYI